MCVCAYLLLGKDARVFTYDYKASPTQQYILRINLLILQMPTLDRALSHQSSSLLCYQVQSEYQKTSLLPACPPIEKVVSEQEVQTASLDFQVSLASHRLVLQKGETDWGHILAGYIALGSSRKAKPIYHLFLGYMLHKHSMQRNLWKLSHRHIQLLVKVKLIMSSFSHLTMQRKFCLPSWANSACVAPRLSWRLVSLSWKLVSACRGTARRECKLNAMQTYTDLYG